MISHQVLTRSNVGNSTVKAIESYYKDAKDDYYSKDNQPSMWQGKLAEELGLVGEVQKEHFIQLMSGISPDHKQLRQNQYTKKDAKERLAVDLTFSAPKSISIESLVNGNKNVLKAHEDAVTKTLELIEQRANTRFKKDGVSKTVNTGNLAIGKFRHETNRNNDPHLHTHAVILNITKRSDGEYRALHNDSIIKSTKEFTKVYQGFLAKELKEQGFKIRLTKDGFELAHINDNQIKAFSSRSKEVEQALAEVGLTRETASTADKQKATLSTRQRKNEKDIIQTRNAWSKSAKEFGIKPFEVKKEIIIEAPKQRTLEAFETAFNAELSTINEIADLQQVESLYEQSGTDPRQFDFSRSNSHGIESRPGTDFSRGLADFIESNRRTQRGKTTESEKGREYDTQRESTERIKPSYSTRSYQESFNQNFGYKHNQEIQRFGLTENTVLTREFSSDNFREYNSTGNKYFGDSMRIMSSSFMADSDRFNTVLLPVDQKVFFQYERASFSIGLSRGDDSLASDAGTIKINEQDLNEKQESLDDIFTYHLIDDAMREKWKDKLEPITEDDLNNEVIYFESKEQLKEFVIEHLTDKDSVIHKKDLEKQLTEKGLGLISHDDLDTIINEMLLDNQLLVTDQLYNLNGELLTEKGILKKLELPQGSGAFDFDRILKNNKVEKLDAVYTTPAAYKRDHLMLSMLDYSKDKNTPALKSDEAIQQLEKTTLNEGQRRCAEMVLTSSDSIIGIQGYAGTGKSYMLTQTKDILEKTGKKMHFFAPYASQVKNLQKDGLEANTLAKFLANKSMHKKMDENSVVVIDESGVINSKQMYELMTIRQHIGFQVILLGDTAQTKAVEAGSPFELLQQNGMRIEKMTDIQRQKKEELKQAVVMAVNNKMDDSVKNLKDLYEIKDTNNRHSKIVETYMTLSEEDRLNTLIVAGTNNDRASINDKIREQLGVKDKGIVFKSLVNSDITDAERKLAFFYKEGDVVKFSKDYKNEGVIKETPYTVVSIDNKKNFIILKDDNNNEFKVNPKTKSKNISVYSLVDIEMSKGDKIRITKTENDKQLATGDLFEIQSISKDSGQAVGRDTDGKLHTFSLSEKHHVTHAYAMTVHASQGLTYNNVIADLNTKSLTLSKETFYVAISRAKYNAFVFTEDKKQLPEAVLRSTTKSNAISLFDDNIVSKSTTYEKTNTISDIIIKDSNKTESFNNNRVFNRGDKMMNTINVSDLDNSKLSKSVISEIGEDKINQISNEIADHLSEGRFVEASKLRESFVEVNEIPYDNVNKIVKENFDDILVRLTQESKDENYSNVHHYVADKVNKKMLEGEITVQEVITAFENKDFDNTKNITLFDVIAKDAIDKSLSEISQQMLDRREVELMDDLDNVSNNELSEYSSIQSIIDDFDNSGLSSQQLDSLKVINNTFEINENEKIKLSEIFVYNNNVNLIVEHNSPYTSHQIEVSQDGSLSIVDNNSSTKQFSSSSHEVEEAINNIIQDINDAERLQDIKESVISDLELKGYKVYEHTEYANDSFNIAGDQYLTVLMAENDNNTYEITAYIRDEDKSILVDFDSQKFNSEHREKHTFTLQEHEIKGGIHLEPEAFKYNLHALEPLNAVETNHYSNDLKSIENSSLNSISHSHNLSFKVTYPNEEVIYSRTIDDQSNITLKANDESQFHKENPQIINKFVAENSKYYKVELQSEHVRAGEKGMEAQQHGKNKQDELEM
ncbi:MobF family relaxase [Acinetobacter pittii]|uniref:MobF family relaxase n=1 Tax=Acinetobacter pittii TaxID=48296 RepID=UPI003260246D